MGFTEGLLLREVGRVWLGILKISCLQQGHLEAAGRSSDSYRVSHPLIVVNIGA